MAGQEGREGQRKEGGAGGGAAKKGGASWKRFYRCFVKENEIFLIFRPKTAIW